MIEVKKFEADWCGPCRMLKPVFTELEQTFGSSVNFSYINVDEKQELATKYGVRSIPFVVFEKDGEIVKTLAGANSKTTYEHILNGLK